MIDCLEHYPHPSKRQVMIAKNGMVATSQPLAAQAGLDILKKGGNAIDAAVATAACLSVVEPCSNGIGGDAFAIVYYRDELHGLNASGKSPASLSIDAIKARGLVEMPRFGMEPISVPGTPKAWAELIERFGKLSLEEVLKPAIDYAKNGFPVSLSVANSWQKAFALYQNQLTDSMFEPWFKCFAPKGRAPLPGELWQSIDHGETLEKIAASNSDAFYFGELAEAIANYSKHHRGFITLEDLNNHQNLWVHPISVNYRGYDVWELPPNGQGLVALQALNILKNFSFREKNAQTIHRQIEAMKLAFADGLRYITDPDYLPYSVSELLGETYATKRSATIDEHAQLPEPGFPSEGGTVYLATADADGNMVSYIQSNYMGFGSGIVIPNTGIAMQNRGHTFSLDPSHPNHLAGNKRTYHTIIPGFLTKDHRAIGPFGVMGGFMQPQGHLQVVMNTLDFAMNPQAALDAPRWQWMKDKTVGFEADFPKDILNDLSERGHDIRIINASTSFGNGQIIWRDSLGTLYGGTEKRTDGHIALY